MKKLLLLSAFLIFTSSLISQTTSHRIFDIDLNKDWYTLTGQSAIAYYMQEDFKKKNNKPGVAVEMDEEYLINNADKEFLELGLYEIILIFEQGQQNNLRNISPSMMTINLMKYGKSEKSAENKIFSKLSSLLMNQFGPPSSTMKKEWGASFQWELTDASIVLNLRYGEISVYYVKSSMSLET